jgi:hypothetical protein
MGFHSDGSWEVQTSLRIKICVLSKFNIDFKVFPWVQVCSVSANVLSQLSFGTWTCKILQMFFQFVHKFGVLGDPRCPVWRSETIMWGAWQRCGRSFDLLPGKFGGVENVPTRHFVDDPLPRQCWIGQIQHQCTRKTTYFIIFMHEIWCNHLFPNLKTETTHARPDGLSQVSNTDLPGWVVQTYQLAQCPWLVKQVMTRRANSNVNDP